MLERHIIDVIVRGEFDQMANASIKAFERARLLLLSAAADQTFSAKICCWTFQF